MRTAVDVHNYLLEREVAHELVPMAGRVRSPERAAAVLGLEPEQVGRVVLFERDGDLLAALLPADRDPDATRLAEAAGGAAVPLTPSRASDLTGFLHEALPPVGLPEGTRVLLDEALAGQDVLYFPGGEATSMLKIRTRDLVAVTEATAAPLT